MKKLKGFLSAALCSSFLIISPTFASERLDINTASAEQIDKTLVFVGSKTAQRIVEYRDQYGKFLTKADLAKVKGVSKRMVRMNRSRIEFK